LLCFFETDRAVEIPGAQRRRHNAYLAKIHPAYFIKAGFSSCAGKTLYTAASA